MVSERGSFQCVCPICQIPTVILAIRPCATDTRPLFYRLLGGQGCVRSSRFLGLVNLLAGFQLFARVGIEALNRTKITPKR